MERINGIHQKNVDAIQTTAGQKATQFSPLFEFAGHSYDDIKDNVSDAKIITENFTNEVMSKLDTSKSKQPPKTIKYYLGKLIKIAQVLNGVQKNNLKPQGTSAQNDLYNLRLQEIKCQMRDYAEFVGSGLNIVQDSKTGLYKLCINNKLFDIPERKVEIVTQDTEDGVELMPEIVD